MCPGGSSSPTWGTEQFKASLNNLVRVWLKIDYMFRKECLGVQFSGRALSYLSGALDLILSTPEKERKAILFPELQTKTIQIRIHKQDQKQQKKIYTTHNKTLGGTRSFRKTENT